jgi:hypothetical protein
VPRVLLGYFFIFCLSHALGDRELLFHYCWNCYFLLCHATWEIDEVVISNFNIFVSVSCEQSTDAEGREGY